MSTDPISLTFDVLAATSRPEADDVLIVALGSPRADVRERAEATICRRGSGRGLLELVRRLDDLSDETRRLLAEPSEGLTRAIRQALKHGDDLLIGKVLELVRSAGHVEQVPAVCGLLKARSPAVQEAAGETLTMLAEGLYDLWRNPARSGDRGGRTEISRTRADALDALATACEAFETLPDPDRVVEALLSIGQPRDLAVNKVLRQAAPDCRTLAGRLLTTSRHPGVMRLAFEFLAEPYPPKQAFEALRTRDDPEFIAALLRWFPEQPSPTLVAALRQVYEVPWLADPERIGDIPEPLHGRLPAFILATGLPEPRKMELQEWVVRHGSAAARRSATRVFDRLDFETTRRILLDSLESEDEQVSAWAASQLRTRHVPGAFRMLIDRLDSESEVVQEAAREQLRGFTVEHVVAICDRLPPSLVRRASELIRKIDPDCVAKFASMINGPIHRQRIAAAQAVGRLGLVGELRYPLLSLLGEEDTALRRVGVEALSRDDSPEVRDALRELLSDPSPRVRQSAAQALDGAEAAAEPAPA